LLAAWVLGKVDRFSLMQLLEAFPWEVLLLLVVV